MGCFSVQKSRKKTIEQQTSAPNNMVTTIPDLEPTEDLDNLKRSNFPSKGRVMQNAQRFINSNPKLRSSHPSYGTRADRDADRVLSPGISPTLPLAGRTRSGTELGSAIFSMASASTPLDRVTQSSRPLPLPFPLKPSGYRLPRPQEHFSAPINSPSSSKVPRSSGLTKGVQTVPAEVHTSLLQPLPPPRQAVSGLRFYTLEELAATCDKFSLDGGASASYTGVIKTDLKGEKQKGISVARVSERWQQVCLIELFWSSLKLLTATATHFELRLRYCLHSQGYREWLSELSTVACLKGPHFCKIIGFHAEDGGTDSFLIYERLPKGSLDRLLYGRTESPPLDWSSRVNIALGAAQGLADLHEKTSEWVAYIDFRASNIDVDMDFSSKLSGYGYFGCRVEVDCVNSQVIEAYCAPETTSEGNVSCESNVWSFGVLLLELLTGRQHMDLLIPKDERNLVKWTRPFLMDEGRLFLIMDPKLQGRFPIQGAKRIADLAYECLQKEPSRRPLMRNVVDIIKSVKEMRYLSRFPLKEPSTAHLSSLLPNGVRVFESPNFHSGASRAVGGDRKIPTKFDV
eukprot:c28909_g2_i3 orf=2-1714(-)